MTGSKYHKVYARIWTSRGFRSWSDDARLAAFYVLTCAHRNTEGLFRLPLPLAQHELGWAEPRTVSAVGELEDAGFVALDRDADLVWLVNALKWEPPRGPKQIKGAVNALAEIPESPLRAFYLAHCQTVCPDLATAIEAGLDWAVNPIEGVSEGLPAPDSSPDPAENGGARPDSGPDPAPPGETNPSEGVSEPPRNPSDCSSSSSSSFSSSNSPSSSSSTATPRPEPERLDDDDDETHHRAIAIDGLAAAGFPDLTPNRGEIEAVRRALTDGATYDDILDRADRAAASGARDVRAYWARSVSNLGDDLRKQRRAGSTTAPPRRPAVDERRPLLDDERTPCDRCGAYGWIDAEGGGVERCPDCAHQTATEPTP